MKLKCKFGEPEKFLKSKRFWIVEKFIIIVEKFIILFLSSEILPILGFAKKTIL